MKFGILSEQFGFVAVSIGFLAFSIVSIAWPEVIGEWVKDFRPSLGEADFNLMLPIVRLIGIGGLVLSAYFLFIIVRTLLS